MSISPVVFVLLFVASTAARDFRLCRIHVTRQIGCSRHEGSHRLARDRFFDVARKMPIGDELSKESVFDLIGLAQRLEAGKPNYEVASSSDGRRVAF